MQFPLTLLKVLVKPVPNSAQLGRSRLHNTWSPAIVYLFNCHTNLTAIQKITIKRMEWYKKLRL